MEPRQEQSQEVIALNFPKDIYQHLAALATKNILSPSAYVERALKQREHLEFTRDDTPLRATPISRRRARDILVQNRSRTKQELADHEPYIGIRPSLAGAITITRSTGDLFHLQATALKEGFDREEEYIFAARLLSFDYDENNLQYRLEGQI